MSANEDLMDMLTGIMSQMSDISEEFITMKDIDTVMANCMKTKVPPPFLCRIYEIGNLINNLRTARWAAYVSYERSKSVVAVEEDPTVSVTSAAAAPTDKTDPNDDAEKALTYQQFVKKMRPGVKAAHADWTTQQIITEIARLWKEEKKAADAVEVKSGGSVDSGKEEKPKKTKVVKNEEEAETKPKKGKGKAVKEEAAPVAVPEEKKEVSKPIDLATLNKISAGGLISLAALQPAPVAKSEPEAPPLANDAPKKGKSKKADVPVGAQAAPAPAQEPVAAEKPRGRPKKDTTPPPAAPASAPAPVAPVAAPAVPAAEDTLATRRKAIPKHVKTLVWNRYVGENRAEAPCLCCRSTRIAVTNFHCGHVVAEAKGGDLTVPNLRPICAPCNLSMGTMSMNEFAKTYFGWEVV